MSRDPWADEPTQNNSETAAALRREEQKREERLRAEAIRLMDERQLETFAEALEMVRDERNRP